MNIINAVIIEDEEKGRALLKAAVERFVEEVEIIGLANDVESGIEMLHSKQPDLVFLDIQLGSKTGFDVLEACKTLDFKVIFVTAHDHYAIKAVRYAAFDYLLKPLDIPDLKAAIDRLKSIAASQKPNLQFLETQLYEKDEPTDQNQLMIPSHQGYQLIQLDELLAVKADSSYVFFVFEGGKQLLATKSLTYYEDLLPANIFFRIHRSHIVNLKKVKSIDRGRTGMVHLNSGESFEIAARKKPQLIRHYNEIAG